MRLIDLMHDALLARRFQPSADSDQRAPHGHDPDDRGEMASHLRCPLTFPSTGGAPPRTPVDGLLSNPIPAWAADRHLIITTDGQQFHRCHYLDTTRWEVPDHVWVRGYAVVTVPETIAALDALAVAYDRMTPWDWPT